MRDATANLLRMLSIAPAIAALLFAALVTAALATAAPGVALTFAADAPGARQETDVPIGGAATDGVPGVDEVHAAIQRGVDYLLSSQNDDGSWGGFHETTFTSSFANPATYHCWSVGTTGLAALALMEVGTTEETRAAVVRGLEFLMANADLKRPAEWDVDNNWGLIYGLRTLARALRDERFLGTEMEGKLRDGAMTMMSRLERYTSPRGGWGYYANPSAAWRPDWATSFMTATGVLALLEAREAGLQVNQKILDAAVRAILRCRQPNGAYLYSVDAVPRHLRMESINQVKGSLGRIQVCNYALHRAGVDLSPEELEEGVESFFRDHKFLDVARNKPIPHEAYYANAAYFYLFGHYYAAFAIDSLPEESRDRWARQLRHPIMKTQQPDGAMWDFWIGSSGKPYGTAFGIMGLARTIR